MYALTLILTWEAAKQVKVLLLTVLSKRHQQNPVVSFLTQGRQNDTSQSTMDLMEDVSNGKISKELQSEILPGVTRLPVRREKF